MSGSPKHIDDVDSEALEAVASAIKAMYGENCRPLVETDLDDPIKVAAIKRAVILCNFANELVSKAKERKNGR
jgi:hypothetical protein